ncbi:MAG: hypothetical protein ACLFWB_05905 [Armatimonadota bacterium]
MKPLAVVLICLLPVLPLCREPVQPADDTDTQIIEAFLGHTDGVGGHCTPERMARFASQPEDITWQASRYINMALVAYKLTGDTQYLDMFVTRTDALLQQLETGPDGFRGWYGLPLQLFRHPDHPDRQVDVMLTSFVMAGLVAEFAATVDEDGLSAEYGPRLVEYLELAAELVEKWHARGCYHDLGTTGAVYTTHPDLKPVKGDLTQPHNKHSKILRALVHMYAATGDDSYMRRAVKLGTRFKHCLTLVGDRYRWNYLDPAGAWDLHPEKPNQWKHWIGPEHRGGYYNLSVKQGVMMYQLGLIFDRTDMDRFARTQTEVCWNGSFDNPQWVNVDGQEKQGQTYLCSWLAPFDERINRLAHETFSQEQRHENRGHSWQGGTVASEYLESKYLLYPKWSDGQPSETDVVADFLADPENAAFVEHLDFTVTPETSYTAPATPAQMTPMPGT